MNVCLVTHRYPPQSGGVETHVFELATRLVERGHDVTVVSADAGGEGHRRERRDGVRVRRVRAVAPGDAIHFAPGVVPAVRRELDTADVVHVHNYHSMPFAFGGLTASLSDTRVVATPHYHAGSGNALRDRLLALYRPFGAATISRADAVLAVSDWERRQLAADFDAEATVVPNGVYRDRFRDAEPYGHGDTDPHGHGASDGDNHTEPHSHGDTDSTDHTDSIDHTDSTARPYLLSVGRLEPYKGVQHVIGALAELPEYDLLVAGSGSYREELESCAADAGVADRLSFLGYVDSERLPSLYAGAAAHVTLSTHEAYGMTVAESIAAGTPVVVRESGALVDWTDERGVVGVESVDPAAVAEAVRSAVGGPEPDPTAVPTWETVVDRVADSYRP
ncbi:MAG: glycosyltransferase family 4 protein [Halobaculum sp.]